MGKIGLFGKTRRAAPTGGLRLPADFGRTLEQYGRFTFDPAGSGIDPGQIGDGAFEYELWVLAQPDADAFIRAVAAVAIPAGGWAVYGGAKAVWNSVGTDVEHPDYLAMLDASIEFILRTQGRGTIDLAPYEIARWKQTQEHSVE